MYRATPARQEPQVRLVPWQPPRRVQRMPRLQSIAELEVTVSHQRQRRRQGRQQKGRPTCPGTWRASSWCRLCTQPGLRGGPTPSSESSPSSSRCRPQGGSTNEGRTPGGRATPEIPRLSDRGGGSTTRGVGSSATGTGAHKSCARADHPERGANGRRRTMYGGITLLDRWPPLRTGLRLIRAAILSARACRPDCAGLTGACVGRERGHRESCNLCSGWPDSEPGGVPSPIVHVAVQHLPRSGRAHLGSGHSRRQVAGGGSTHGDPECGGPTGGHFPLRSSARVA